MPLDFPSSPSLNQTYTYNDRTWIWNGSAWILVRQINNTPIGNSTANSGAFTTLSSSGNTSLGNINSNLNPAANVTYDLGSNTARWNDVWLSNATIYIGDTSISGSGANVVFPSITQIGNAAILASSGDMILPGGTTVNGTPITPSGGSAPLISSIQVTNSSWTVLDDIAVNIDGGYIVINGSNFASNAQVLIDNTTATSVSFVSSSVLRVQVPAKAAGTYILYVINPGAGTAISVNGISYSDNPTWLTNSPIVEQAQGIAVSFQLNATDSPTYTVQAGSSLPPGLSLSSGGLISGTVTGLTNTTVYNFTLVATDAELQETPQAFSLTVNVLPAAGLYVWGSNNTGQLGLNDTINRSSPIQVGSGTDWNNVVATNNGPTQALCMATKTDGTLWTWGNNTNGTLGLNDTIARSSPVQIGSETSWSVVAWNTGGSAFPSGGIKYNGTLWMWGTNTAGCLGLNDTINRSSPTQVGSDNQWKDITVGVTNALALKTNGTLWAWGLGSSGQNGVLDVISRSSPVQIGTDNNWTSFTCSTAGAMAVKNTGTLWAWGNGSGAKLGLNSTLNRSSPTQVGVSSDWQYVTMGSPGTGFAVKNNGTLWGWGQNGGQLGINNTIVRSSPVQIGALSDWSMVETINSVTLATKTNGTLWTWGVNGAGQLGLNDIIWRSSPVQVGAATNWRKFSPNIATRLA